MGINLGGMGAAYQGFRDDQLTRAEEERRVKQDARLDQDQEYQQESRQREREAYSRSEKNRLADEAARKKAFETLGNLGDNGEGSVAPVAVSEASAPTNPFDPVDTRADGAANEGVKPATQGASNSGARGVVIQRPVGIPKTPSFHDMLNAQSSVLADQLSRGTADASTLAAHQKLVKYLEDEGQNAALQHFSRGEFQEGLDKFNSIGMHRKAKIISTRPGTYNVDGKDMPTQIVTLQGSNGQPITIDVAQSLASMRAYQDQLKGAEDALIRKNNKEYQDGTLKIQQQNANTNEGYRRDQAKNMLEQRNLRGATTAPVWDKDADKQLEAAFTVDNPETGKEQVDYDGLMVSKPLAARFAQVNGGDTQSAIAAAAIAYREAKKSAGNDPTKLQALMQQAVAKLAALQSAGQAAAPGEWAGRNAQYASEAPGRQSDRLTILTDALAEEQSKPGGGNPADIAAMKREISNISKSSPVTASARVIPVVGGIRPPQAAPRIDPAVAQQRNELMQKMNTLSGNNLSKREKMIADREREVKENFDGKLAELKQGMDRQEIFKALEWFSNNESSMTNAQLKQLRDKRKSLGY